MIDPLERAAFVSDAIFVDEVGIEIGVYREFRLKSAYQPIFRRGPSTLRPIAVEGLVAPFRDGQPMPAGMLFEGARREDRLFIESMCRALHLRNHHNIGAPDVQLFFNYDPSANSDLEKSLREIAFMARRLAEIELDPRLLVCEITEHAPLDQSVLVRLVEEMRGHGIRIALDDFGSGHSTFERIKLLKPDIVKTDGPWFRRLCADEPTAKLFAPITAQIRNLGANLLVEGVETPLQLQIALDAGAELFQGYLLGRPALAGTIFDETPLEIEQLLRTEPKVVSLFG